MGTSKTMKAIYTSPFTYIVLCLLCGLCGCYGVAFGFELIINMVMLGIGFGISKIYT